MIARAHAAGVAGAALIAFSASAAEFVKPGEWRQTDNATGLSVLTRPYLADITPGGQSNGAALAIRCRSGQTSVEIMWGGPSKTSSIPITVAIDDLPPSQETWTADDETKLLVGLRDSKSAIDFLNRAFPSDVLTLQFRTNKRISVFSFKMSKAEPYLRAIADRCGWTLQ